MMALLGLSGKTGKRDAHKPLQARMESGEDVFGPLIRRFLLENRHRVTVEVWDAAASS